jgi:hypothetical protein
MTGEFTDLSDNLFTLSGVTTSDVLTFSVDNAGPDAEGILQVWADATTLHHAEPIQDGDQITVGVPATGDVTVLVDWKKAFGSNQDFAVSAEITGDQQHLTIPAGGTESVTATLAQFDQLVASQRNPAGASLSVAILDSTSTELVSQTLAPDAKLGQVVFADGDYTVELTNNTASDVNATVFLNVIPPADLGTIAPGSQASSPAQAIASGGDAYYLLSASAGEVLSFSHDNDQAQDVDYAVFAPDGTEISSGAGVDARSDAANYSFEDVIWNYLDSDVTFLIELTASGNLTNQTLDVESQTPSSAGTLDFQSSVSMNSSAALDKGYSEYHLVEFTDATTFYGTLSPGAGESVAFYLYDDALDPVVSDSGAGDVNIAGKVEAAGTYLVRVAADEATAAYNLTLNGIIDQENLGALNATTSATSSTLPVFDRGQTMTLNFSVPAGHVIEVSHDNAEGEDHEAYLYDDAEQLLTDDIILEATSNTDPEYMYWYTEDGGDFELVLEGWNTTTDQTISLRAIEPGDFGQISSGNSPPMSVADAIGAGQSYFHFVEFTETAYLDGILSPANAESLNFSLYDLENTEIIYESGSGGDVTFVDSVDEVGTYLVRVQANEAATGFDLTLNATANSEDLGLLTGGTEFVSPTFASFDGSRTYTLNFSVPAGQVIELSHENAESEDHEAFLYDDQGDLLWSDYLWYTRSYTTPDYMYWYSHDGGTFEFVLEGWSTTTNEEVTLRVIDPEDMGQLGAGDTLTSNETEAKSLGQSYFKRIDFTEALSYDVTLSPTGGEDLNFALQDTNNAEVLSEDGTGGDVVLTGETVVAAGSYLVAVEADEAATGFDLTFDNATSIQENLGALAAAYEARDLRAMGVEATKPHAQVCGRARTVLTRNGARLHRCEVHRDGSVTVESAVTWGPGEVCRTARAGTAP